MGKYRMVRMDGESFRCLWLENIGAVSLVTGRNGKKILRLPEGAPEDSAEMFLEGWKQGRHCREWETGDELRWQGMIREAFLEAGEEPVQVTMDAGPGVWGSCEARRQGIHLNAGLSGFPLASGRSVLMHEICHLRDWEHTASFWQHLTSLMPEWPYWDGMLRGMAAVKRRNQNRSGMRG